MNVMNIMYSGIALFLLVVLGLSIAPSNSGPQENDFETGSGLAFVYNQPPAQPKLAVTEPTQLVDSEIDSLTKIVPAAGEETPKDTVKTETE